MDSNSDIDFINEAWTDSHDQMMTEQHIKSTSYRSYRKAKTMELSSGIKCLKDREENQ